MRKKHFPFAQKVTDADGRVRWNTENGELLQGDIVVDKGKQATIRLKGDFPIPLSGCTFASSAFKKTTIASAQLRAHQTQFHM